MVSDPETHAYRECAWCHCLKPQRETVTWNGKHVCADGDCLLNIRSKSNAFSLTDRFAGGLISSRVGK